MVFNMSNIAEFWSSLGYNGYFFILLIILFVIHLIVMISRGVILVSKPRTVLPSRNEGVSVIITCSNKADLLKKNLEVFLKQDYPLYEVIVVDECSEDDTQDVLADLQTRYPHLKTTRIFPDTKFRRTKKIAINIGVLAARYDILLFTEINCLPESDHWIEAMSSHFTPDTAVVIGYSNYMVKEEAISFRRFFRFLWFWKTYVQVKQKLFVTGNGTNMGYRKKFYLETRGYSRNTQEYIGYDTEMVKKIAPKGKVRMAKEMEARILIEEKGFQDWKDDFSYYFATKQNHQLYM